MTKKFYGQFDPSVDRFIFERYFPDENIKGIYVECGAYDGLTECSCKFFEETMGWTGYNLEPLPWIYDQLCINRPESNNLNFALSNKKSVANFKAVNHPQFGTNCTNGSLTHSEKHTKLLVDNGCDFIDVPVNLLAWNDFIQQEQINHIDLLVLDVEGHELFVLEGMANSKVLPDVICIEIGHLDFAEIKMTLHKMGYVYDINSHANAFFVKKELLALFSFRRANVKQNILVEYEQNDTKIEALKQSESLLQQDLKIAKEHIKSLDGLLNEILHSKAWRLIEKFRNLKNFGRMA